MKKLIILITLLVQSALLFSCQGEPDYFEDYDEFIVEVAPYVGTRIMHVSDVHCCFGPLAGLLKVAEQCAEIVVNTGDDTKGTPGCSFSDIADDFSDYRSVVNGCRLPVIGVQGNHDAFCTSRQYREAMFDEMPFVTPGDATGSYGYYDYGDLRFVLLDPRDSGLNDDEIIDWWTAIFSQRQVDWLIATLDDARTRGLGVVTVMHYGFGDNKVFDHDNLRPDIDYAQNPFMIPDIIEAMQKGDELKASYSTKGADGGKIEVNIPSSALKLEHIVHLYGHLHSKGAYKCAKSDGSHDYNILMIGEAALARKGGMLDTIERDKDDIVASLLVIDRPSRQVHRISYGAYADNRHQTFDY